MNSKKVIQINPELFNMKKEKKNSPKNQRPSISPNVIKNKFLKRIKEHKLKEIEKAQQKGKDNINEKTSSLDANKYSDEFNDSIEYLQNISKQKKLNEKKTPEQIQKQREQIENKTLKHYSYVNTPVNIDLPDELKEIVTPVRSEIPIRLNYQFPNNVPYGVLKNGLKPTFREWNNKTKKNAPIHSSTSVSSLSVLNEREQKLQLLRERIKQKQLSSITPSNPIIPSPLQSLPSQSLPSQSLPSQSLPLQSLPLPSVPIPLQSLPSPSVPLPLPLPSQSPSQTSPNDIMMTQNLIQKPKVATFASFAPVSINSPSLQSANLNQKDIPKKGKFIKRITKKTIKHKYTLGKSKIKKVVSVLLKDQNTRKKIQTAQKDLKHHSIHDIKKYLKNHHLIKIGSHAPNDVIRKLYESAMLTGEVTNLNAETILHNFMKDDTND